MALKGSSNAEKIWNYLYAKIGNAYGVAGLIGNLYAESALNPQNLQQTYEAKLGYTDATYTAAVDSGTYTNFAKDSAGYGLAQWTYWSRKQNLLDYAQAAGSSIGDLEMQLGFLYKELSGSYKAVLSTLKGAASVQEASDTVLVSYEKPANQGDTVKSKRAGYGQSYYEKYAGTAGSQSGGTSKMSKYYASTVIAVAAEEVGYQEKLSKSNLDDKTANSGNKNYTKYARDFDEKYPNWYNGKKNGYAWCDVFVDWCFLTAFGYEAALSLLCQPEKSAGAGCTYSLGYYRNKGQFHTSGPKAGDQIFFGPSVSDADHTGIVEKVDTTKVYTIEGNASDCVARRTYLLSDSSIIGYGRPKYDAEPATTSGSTSSSSNSSSAATFSIGDIVKFTGTSHYASASATSAKTCKPGVAKVTAVYKNGKHPYHLIAESGGGSTVYGWVDSSYVETYSSSASTASTSSTTTATTAKVTASSSAKSFSKSLAGTYTVKTALHCRDGAGTSYKSLVVIPKGTSVKNYGYYTAVSGVKWLYIQFTLDGTVYTGFSSSAYLTKA